MKRIGESDDEYMLGMLESIKEESLITIARKGVYICRIQEERKYCDKWYMVPFMGTKVIITI